MPDIHIGCCLSELITPGKPGPMGWPKCSLAKGHSGPHYDGSRGVRWEPADSIAPVAPGLANRAPVSADYSQLSHIALRLMAETQAEGNNRYGVGNWQKGLPVSNLLSHAIAHILAVQNGDVSENHLGHALWNLEKAAHFIATRPELIDVLPLRKAMGLPPLTDDTNDKR